MSLAAAAELPRFYPIVEVVRYRPTANRASATQISEPKYAQRPSLLAELLVTVLFTGVGLTAWAVASAIERGRDPHIG